MATDEGSDGGVEQFLGPAHLMHAAIGYAIAYRMWKSGTVVTFWSIDITAMTVVGFATVALLIGVIFFALFGVPTVGLEGDVNV